MLPDSAPDWAHALDDDTSALRAELWNRVEEIETHSKARVAREIQLGLAYELTRAEQKELLKTFVQREVVERGFAADVAIHDYGRTIPSSGASDIDRANLRSWANRNIPFLTREDAQGLEEEHVIEIYRGEGDERQLVGFKHYQPHAHVYVTPRVFVDGEFEAKKSASRELNKAETAKEWRYEWPKMQSDKLADNGIDVTIKATSEAEDKHRDAQFKSEAQDKTIYEIERRADSLDDTEKQRHEEAKAADQANREFNQFQNEALAEALDDTDQVSEVETYDTEQTRAAVWWGLTAKRFATWKDNFAERADEWRDRFTQSKDRLVQRLGWYAEPETDEPHHQETTGLEERGPSHEEPDEGLNR